MDKLWLIYSTSHGPIKTGIKSYEDAERQSKILAGGANANRYGEIAIYEMVAYAQVPVPQIDIIKFTSK
jgi:hypothetical protein